MGKHRTKNRNRTRQKNKLNSKLKKHSSQRKKSTKKRGTKKKRGGTGRLVKTLAASAALAASSIPKAGANRFTVPVRPDDPYAPNNGLEEIGPWTSYSRKPQFLPAVNRHLSTSVIRDKSPKFSSDWAGKTKETINFIERNKELQVITLRYDIGKEWEDIHDPAISEGNPERLNELIKKAKEYKHNPLAWNWEPTDTQWKMAYDLGSEYLTNSERADAEDIYADVPFTAAFTPDHNILEDKRISLGALVESIERGETPHLHPSFLSYHIGMEY